MSNYGTMQARIASELRRGDISASSSVVTNAIQTAILHYQNKRFHFNEETDETIYTSQGEPYLSSVPADIIQIDSLKVVIGTRDYQYIDYIDSGQWTGFPEIYTYYKDLVRLYPIPNGNYQMKFSHQKRLSTLSGDADTNAWMTTGEHMIRARAKGEIYMNYLHNTAKAHEFYGEAEMARSSILDESEAKLYSGKIRSTSF